MAGRKADPNTRYKVYIHKDKKYIYAAIQEPRKDPQTSKIKLTTVHLGKIDKNNTFIPNSTFRHISPDERKKYIFPQNLDLSNINLIDLECDDTNDSNEENNLKENKDEKICNRKKLKEYKQSENAIQNVDKCYNDEMFTQEISTHLYGSFWLLEQIAINTGLYDDLLTTFDENCFIVKEILSLSIYSYISNRNFNRFGHWQNTHKTMIDYQLTPYDITKLTQRINDNHRMSLIKLRLKRLPENCLISCDSTTRSAWGKCLADIHWGKNKDNEKLKNTVEVIVYSITTHQPIYYRSFSGNTSDMSTVYTILTDLQAIGIDNHDITFITDRGYISEENIASFVAANLPFLMCAKVGHKPISTILLDIKYDKDGFPIGMMYNEESRLYYAQIDIPPYNSKLPDGSEIEITGLKVNLYLDIVKRVNDIADLRIKIENERNTLLNDKNKNFIPNDLRRYRAFFEYFKINYSKDKDGNTIGIEYFENKEKINKEKSKFGFFCSVMYNMDKNCIESLDQYKERDEHEKCFDILKNQMCFYSQRSSSEGGKNGRSLIAFAGLIPISFLRNVWKTLMINKYSSALEMIDEMESIRYSKYSNGKEHMTTFTMKQVEICRACGIEPPYNCLPSTLKREIDRNKGRSK